MNTVYIKWNNISKKIVNNEIISWKKHIDVIYMLEHTNEIFGKIYLELLKKDFMIDFIKDIIFENDKYGDPEKYYFIEDNFEASPSSLRYLYQANEILKLIKSKNLKDLKIVEIGGGYGGLCLITHLLFKKFNINIDKYVIYDLKEIQNLQKYYLNNFNYIENIVWNDSNTFGEDLKDDNYILVSNYALSEIDIEYRLKYLKNLLPKVSSSFMIWNSDNIKGLESVLNIKQDIEYPQTGLCNTIITF